MQSIFEIVNVISKWNNLKRCILDEEERRKNDEERLIVQRMRRKRVLTATAAVLLDSSLEASGPALEFLRLEKHPRPTIYVETGHRDRYVTMNFTHPEGRQKMPRPEWKKLINHVNRVINPRVRRCTV
jgi:hypothetical protein